MTVAALYVEPKGVYSTFPDVELWDKKRDARKYAGPWPVVAHPPCARWGRYWFGGPSSKRRAVLGDDNGCFAHALDAVMEWGGVLEHPADSHAWGRFGLNRPPRSGGWVAADFDGGWTCCVDQGHYGHRAQKSTWLYAIDCDLPSLVWGRAEGRLRLDAGFHSAEERRVAKAAGWIEPERVSDWERKATPLAFAELLIEMARSAIREERHETGSP